MLVYSAKFTVNENLDIEKFIELAIDWVSHPNSHYNFPEFKWNGNEEMIIQSMDRCSELSIFVLIEKNTVAVNLKTIDQNNIEWVNYYSLVDNELFVKLEKHSSKEDTYVTSTFHTPYLLKQLYFNNFIIEENPKFTNDNDGYTTLITIENYEIVKNLLLNGNNYNLPIVYVSRYVNDKNQYSYPVNIKRLSTELLGLAHILVEENVEVSQLLRDETDWINPYNGAVQIFFTNNYIKRFLAINYQNENRMRDDIFKTILERAMYQKVDEKFSLTYITNEIYKIHIYNLEKGKDNIKNLEEENLLDKKRIKELEDELSKTKADIFSYQSRISSLQLALDKQSDSEPLLDKPDIDDLYNGEIFDCIFDELKDVIKNIDKETRTYQILDSIINKNQKHYVGEREKKRNKIDKIMHGRSKLSQKDISDLKLLGLEFSGDSHPKVKFPNGSQSVTLFKTPSDKIHGINNLCNDLIKKLF